MLDPPRQCVVPANIADDRLLGGLDIAATLRAGRPVAEPGVIAQADGGVLVLAMAERAPAGQRRAFPRRSTGASSIWSATDSRWKCPRGSASSPSTKATAMTRTAAGFGGPDGYLVDLTSIGWREIEPSVFRHGYRGRRAKLGDVEVEASVIEALVVVAAGSGSPRCARPSSR